jgi:hypothetical protein
MSAAEPITPPVIVKDIPGFPGYRVGSDGSMWSCHLPFGGLGNVWKKLIHLKTARSGYFFFSLRRSGKNWQRGVHRLVLEAFVGPCPPGMEACHNNGIKTDNRLENLRWDTRKANARDRTLHGSQILIGSFNPNAKLTESDIIRIHALADSGKVQREIAAMFGVSETTIGFIRQGKTWKHVV